MWELNTYEDMVEGMVTLAGLIKAYYDALIENGFTKAQAIRLTEKYQDALLEIVKSNGTAQ